MHLASGHVILLVLQMLKAAVCYHYFVSSMCVGKNLNRRSLIKVVLRRALVTYFRKSNEKEATGILSFLSKKPNLHLADLLTVFSRYQQPLQSDSVTLIDMDILGGWVEALSEQVSEEEGGYIFLKGVELNRRNTWHRDYHHLYVTDTMDSDTIKNGIIEYLHEFFVTKIFEPRR